MGRLTGKVALITGAAAGQGAADAEAFAREGAMLMLTDIDVTAGRALAGKRFSIRGTLTGSGAGDQRHLTGKFWAAEPRHQLLAPVNCERIRLRMLARPAAM